MEPKPKQKKFILFSNTTINVDELLCASPSIEGVILTFSGNINLTIRFGGEEPSKHAVTALTKMLNEAW